MILEHIVLQSSSLPAPQLIVLAHGVGANEHDLAPVGQLLGQQFPNAWVVSLRAPAPCDFAPGGYQWFSLQGITEANRAERVAVAVPAYMAAVREWQQRTQASAEATCLVGFSQGAIMALEAVQEEGEPLAGRVVALSGRLGGPARRAPPATTLHLIHGKHDEVIAYAHAVRAAEALIALGADVTADIIPFLGHGVNEEVMTLIVQRLTTYLPRRRWDEALRAAPG